MPEWLIQLLLVPAVLVSMTLLVSFAACDRVFGLTELPTTLPIIDSATGKDGTTISLIWHWDGVPQGYQFERTDPDGAVANFDAPSPALPFDDTGLEPATSYRYRVRGVYNSGDQSDWSAPVVGTTLPLALTYSKALTDPGTINFQGYTLVQRVEPASLGSTTGSHVRITVQASSASDALVDRLSISQQDSTGKPYDSAADLTVVYDSATNQQQPFVVPAGTMKSLPIVAYAINRFQPLLIAIDFSTSVPSGIEFAPSVPVSEASAYYLPPPAGEAAIKIRSPNYVESLDSMGNSTVVFIAKIEVG